MKNIWFDHSYWPSECLRDFNLASTVGHTIREERNLRQIDLVEKWLWLVPLAIQPQIMYFKGHTQVQRVKIEFPLK